ncbi:hypothetical protein [Tenacibaculum sp. SZ-18]|uniref:hypothetical protein n=1 Tax=Tenacibaculum sp. SZ-18 TaxID=754423 RepID=UPI0012FE5E7F|nr:hypothetical protein [Tenacibaculum sp. SZ-18]
MKRNFIFALILVISLSFIFQSCNNNEGIENMTENSTENSVFFVLKDSQQKIITSLPSDLVTIINNEIEKIKGFEASKAFLNTYDSTTGLLKVSPEKALQNNFKSKIVQRNEMVRVPFTLSFEWRFQRWKNARNGYFSSDKKSQSFNPNIASSTRVGHRKTKYRGAKQAMWGFSFGIRDNSNPWERIMETHYPVRLRAFSDANSTWSNWVTLDSDPSTGIKAWKSGKHAEALQIEMLPNVDNNEKLFDLLLYQVYSNGRWQPWIVSPGVAGNPRGSKLQGVHIQGFYF